MTAPVPPAIDVAQALPRRRTLDVVANFLWLTAERALDIVIVLAVSVLMARYLGPERFGTLSYFLGITTLFATVARLGLDQVVIVDLVKDPLKRDRLLGTACVAKFGSGLFAAACMLLSVGLGGGDSLLYGGILATALLAQALDVPEMFFTSRTQSRYPVMSRSMVRIVMGLVRSGAIYVGAPLLAFIGAAAVEPVLIVLVMLSLYQLRGNRPGGWTFDRQIAVSLVRRGFPLMIAGIAIMVMMRIDVVMLGWFCGAATVGIFASAVRVADLCNFLSTGIMVSVAPSLISIRSESEERYTAHIARLFQGLTIVMTLVAILLSLFGDALITLALGPAYEASAAVLRIYIWSAVFIALGVVQGQWLVNEGYEKLILIQGLAGAAVNIAANLILIPAYGAEGAAISTCIAQFTSCVLCNLFYDRRTRMIFMLQMKALVWANIHLLLPARRRPFAASEASAGDD